MPLFLLTPVQLTANEWFLSTAIAPVQVEASDASSARHKAARFFDKRLSSPTGLTSPWMLVDVVTVLPILKIDEGVPLLSRMPLHRSARQIIDSSQSTVRPESKEEAP